jgi:Fe-S oxidoreductase
LELIEMRNNRENSLCCGGGGGGAWREDPPEKRLGMMRVREALDTGAGVIATACPYCTHMLNVAVEQLGVGDRIDVRDVSELLWQSMDVSISADRLELIGRKVAQEVCHA